ncbi:MULTISPECIES: L,D-transpeptidase [unclassified Ruminococcus]|uniref:L,D-transpeptidase n=1 Tax=unclassified Ruminococcus TaxID=2608920 RepID=UPI00210CB700|nr:MULTISPECIES: L,D-transpeptidase [unclassified Ruminococcus]MCQ4022604.1 L,D-transpeptidase family protein [Ruminococcus sp. zg-924]MCQ4114844.1 L,D-transpeptidase family protein [Ruminococcus sp. zg-921]
MAKKGKVLSTGNGRFTVIFRVLCFLVAVIAAAVLLSACCSTNGESAIMVVSSTPITDGEELAVPSAVKLELSSDKRKIKLNWSESKNATGYEVYMSKDGSNYEHLISTNQLNYETKELNTGDTYYFRVKPYNSRTGYDTVYGEATDKSVTCIESQQIDGYDVGDTYIHIDIDKQTMWFYKNNKLLVETPVVTGTAGACDTPTGYFEVRKLASPAHLMGPTWDVTTQYWVGINVSNDIGLHDSQWRDTGYGGDIYTYQGSNGCINTPLDAMKKIYENIVLGTPVVISGTVKVPDTGSSGYIVETTDDTQPTDEYTSSDDTTSYDEPQDETSSSYDYSDGDSGYSGSDDDGYSDSGDGGYSDSGDSGYSDSGDGYSDGGYY